MTGRYNVRNYTVFGELDRREITFGNILQRAGYKTCVVGKWQLGREADSPEHFGFDEACLWHHTFRPSRYANPGLDINRRTVNYETGEYGPDLVTDYAIDFITRNQSQPFFLYYPMILTHSPYQPTPDSDEWDPQLRGGQDKRNLKHFGDMVEYMDKTIGRLVSHLAELELRENTLVIFLGDNGTGPGVTSMMGDEKIAGGKGSTTAAGMHVPLIVNWPGHVEPQVYTGLIDSSDFLPTLLDAAGVTPPESLAMDGVSFLPAITGRSGPSRMWIYCWYCPRPDSNPAVAEFAFDKHYKLYRSGEFFDLRTDREEKQPLQVDELPERTAKVANELQDVLDRYADIRPPRREESAAPQ